MFDRIDIFRTAGAMARHASASQLVVARNIANADTPGYRAAAPAPFAETWRAASRDAGQLHATRAGHRQGSAPDTGPLRYRAAGNGAAPNGNTVSLETEMIAAAGVERAHGRALAIYRHGLDILRLSLGRK